MKGRTSGMQNPSTNSDRPVLSGGLPVANGQNTETTDVAGAEEQRGGNELHGDNVGARTGGLASSGDRSANNLDDQLKAQQAMIQQQVAGAGGVGVVGADLQPDRGNSEVSVAELQKQKHLNLETAKRVQTTLAQKFSEIDKESRKLALIRFCSVLLICFPLLRMISRCGASNY